MQLTNGVEVLRWSPDSDDYITLKAAAADTWAPGAFLYYDSGSSTVKKFAPADSTAYGTNQDKIIGISSNGKVVGQIEAVVCKKATVLMDATTVLIGGPAVVCYVTATGKYFAWGGADYNTTHEPDITLSLDFLTFKDVALEADHRAILQVDGTARLLGLN